jgi:hypothetical protein
MCYSVLMASGFLQDRSGSTYGLGGHMSFQLQCSLRDLHSRSTLSVIGSQLLEKKFCGFLHITGLSPSTFKERVLVWGMVLVESEFCGSSVPLTSSVELETTFPLIVVTHVEGSSEHTDCFSSIPLPQFSTAMCGKARVYHCLPTERKISTGAHPVAD